MKTHLSDDIFLVVKSGFIFLYSDEEESHITLCAEELGELAEWISENVVDGEITAKPFNSLQDIAKRLHQID